MTFVARCAGSDSRPRRWSAGVICVTLKTVSSKGALGDGGRGGSSSVDFELTIGIRDTAAVIHLRGELDLETAPTLQAAMRGALETGVKVVVLDLAELRFLDSYAIGVIVRGGRAAKQAGMELILRDPAPNVERVLAITAINRVFRVEHRAPRGHALN